MTEIILESKEFMNNLGIPEMYIEGNDITYRDACRFNMKIHEILREAKAVSLYDVYSIFCEYSYTSNSFSEIKPKYIWCNYLANIINYDFDTEDEWNLGTNKGSYVKTITVSGFLHDSIKEEDLYDKNSNNNPCFEYDFSDILTFSSRYEPMNILEFLHNITKDGCIIRVNRLYKLVRELYEIDCPKEYNRYAWNNFNDAHISINKDGWYVVHLPAPQLIRKEK